MKDEHLYIHNKIKINRISKDLGIHHPVSGAVPVSGRGAGGWLVPAVQ
jgi:hypothetical protein